MPSISQLPVASVVNVGDLFVIVQGGVTKQATDSLVLASVQTQIQITESQVTNLTTDLAARLLKSANLSDLPSVPTARTNLGLGTMALQSASDYLLLAGGTMTGTLTLNTSSPSAALEAASKGYVDSVATGLNVQGACVAATTVNLTAIYNNAASGVGATLTNSGAAVAFAVDGYSASLNDRILVKNQSTTFQNGIYTVTTVGSGAVNWVLTRATDYDTPAEIQPGDFVLITSGTVNATTSWIQTAVVTAVGTDPVVFAAFSASPSTFLVKANNLSDVANAATSRTNLGLGSVATKTATNAALTNAVMQNGAAVVGRVPKYDDVTGSLIDSGFGITSLVKTVKTQTFVASGTYTPSTGMLFAWIRIVGGGGSGGGTPGNTAQVCVGSGGGAGAYTEVILSAASVGASQVVTIGAGAATGGAANGNPGGTSSVGSITAPGGSGGIAGTASATLSRATGAAGGVAGAGGDIAIAGGAGGCGFSFTTSAGFSGAGGSSVYGAGGQAFAIAASVQNGSAGNVYGAGGGGSVSIGLTNGQGGIGGNGLVIIHEYCSQ